MKRGKLKMKHFDRMRAMITRASSTERKRRRVVVFTIPSIVGEALNGAFCEQRGLGRFIDMQDKNLMNGAAKFVDIFMDLSSNDGSIEWNNYPLICIEAKASQLS